MLFCVFMIASCAFMKMLEERRSIPWQGDVNCEGLVPRAHENFTWFEL